MRTACLIVLLSATAPAVGAPPREKAKAEAAAALALASSCDCPADTRPKCGDVAEVLARVSAEIAEEGKRPAVAPMPRAKVTCDGCNGACDACPGGCGCAKAAVPVSASALPVPAVMPAAPGFTDTNGCRWVGAVGGDGRVTYTRVSCPLRR